MKRIQLTLLASLWFIASLSLAMTNDQLELERLNQIEAELTLQREWADYRWKKTSAIKILHWQFRSRKACQYYPRPTKDP